MWFQWHPSVLVAPVVFQCGLSSGIPVYWQNLVWRSLGQVTSQHATPYVYNWYGESCLNSTDFIWLATPNAQKLEWCSYQRHAQSDVEVLTCVKQNWYPLQSSKLQVKAGYTETGPLAYWCPAILSFQTDMDATLHAWLYVSGLVWAVTVPPVVFQCRLQKLEFLQWHSSVGCFK